MEIVFRSILAPSSDQSLVEANMVLDEVIALIEAEDNGPPTQRCLLDFSDFSDEEMPAEDAQAA